MHATVSHFEIPVDDLERAAAFYRQAFGWRVERLPWEGPGYCTVRGEAADPGGGEAEGSAAVGIGGGLIERRALGVDQPLLVVHVEGATLEECLERIAAAGGTVVRAPEPVGRFGTFARFRDPEGNTLGLWRRA